jgi:hypothetical protein
MDMTFSVFSASDLSVNESNLMATLEAVIPDSASLRHRQVQVFLCWNFEARYSAPKQHNQHDYPTWDFRLCRQPWSSHGNHYAAFFFSVF